MTSHSTGRGTHDVSQLLRNLNNPDLDLIEESGPHDGDLAMFTNVTFDTIDSHHYRSDSAPSITPLEAGIHSGPLSAESTPNLDNLELDLVQDSFIGGLPLSTHDDLGLGSSGQFGDLDDFGIASSCGDPTDFSLYLPGQSSLPAQTIFQQQPGQQSSPASTSPHPPQQGLPPIQPARPTGSQTDPPASASAGTAVSSNPSLPGLQQRPGILPRPLPAGLSPTAAGFAMASTPQNPPPIYPQPPGKSLHAAGVKRPLSEEESARQQAEEDKRRRNTAASARFRQKKKMRERAMEASAKQMTGTISKLQTQIQNLESENQLLRKLLTEKYVAENDVLTQIWHHLDQRRSADVSENDDSPPATDESISSAAPVAASGDPAS